MDINSNIISGSNYINTENYANKELKYFYYFSSSLLSNNDNKIKPLICIPGLSGEGEGFVKDDIREFAENESYFIIAPTFIYDEKLYEHKQSYHFPSVWSGDVLLKILLELEKTFKITFDKFNFLGFSAGAQFSLRFSLWKPELVRSCMAFASGQLIEPQQYNDIKYFISVGVEDRDYRIRNSKNFYQKALQNKISVIFKQYNVDHRVSSEQRKDVFSFLQSIVD